MIYISLEFLPLDFFHPPIGWFQAAGNRLEHLHPKQFEGLSSLQADGTPGLEEWPFFEKNTFPAAAEKNTWRDKRVGGVG